MKMMKHWCSIVIPKFRNLQMKHSRSGLLHFYLDYPPLPSDADILLTVNDESKAKMKEPILFGEEAIMFNILRVFSRSML
mmetsp:Transcript_16545/g.34933  ORF Transcript_16545/g.34933 Transcript_16545/m.34933 type:complete len:80 (-) Transcript_16545:169-408(-)